MKIFLNGFDCRLNKIDSENNDSGSQGMDSVTQETILKFPEYFDRAEASNKNVSVSQGAESATLETMLKFPEIFDAE